jgi:hypothetical protein
MAREFLDKKGRLRISCQKRKFEVVKHVCEIFAQTSQLMFASRLTEQLRVWHVAQSFIEQMTNQGKGRPDVFRVDCTTLAI